MPAWRKTVASTACLLSLTRLAAAPAAPPDYSAVDAIFTQYCLDCHGNQDPEHGLVLESYESLIKGGEGGPAIVAGNSEGSILIRMVEGRLERNGKPKVMPPGKRKKLEPQEIALLKEWIDGGAIGPTRPAIAKELSVPRIVPKIAPRNPINALASSAAGGLLAVARYGEVQLHDAADFRPLRTFPGPKGNVNSVLFTSNDSELFAAGGEPAIAGEVLQWRLADGQLLHSFSGHKDAIYAMAISPDGKTLATGSYDQKIKLWNVADAKEIRTLSGHNGCIYHLAFRPDGKILASASADRTVKLWDVVSGERRETLAQSLKEVFAVVFSPDGKQLYAGGTDSRIRVWEVSENAAETTNPLLQSKFAHEGAILNLIFSSDGKTLISAADDRTIKFWDPLQMREKGALEQQPDWPAALACSKEGKIVVGRLDGTVGFYSVTTGKRLAAL